MLSVFQLLMKGHLDLGRQLSIRTDDLENDAAETEYVQFLPSPHTCSMNHLRRNSTSAVMAGGAYKNSTGGGGPANTGSQADPRKVRT